MTIPSPETVEREAIVRWLRDHARTVQEKTQPNDWPKGAWTARQQGIVSHFTLVANAIERGDHLPTPHQGQ